MSWSQPQFRLHGPSLGSRNFNNFPLFNDEDVEVIGTQMPQNVKGSRDMSMRRHAEDTTRKENNINKLKESRVVASKSKGPPKINKQSNK